MKKPLFELNSPKTGRLYRLTAADIRAFYEEHVLGNADKFRAKVLGTILKREGRVPNFPVVGTVLCQLFNTDGELTCVRAGGNLVVDTGRSAAIDRLQGNTPAVHDYMAIGTGATAPAAGDTTLQTETGTRVQGTLSQPTAYTDRLVSTFAAGNGTATITETGRLNASSTGNLFARYTFTGIAKGASDSLEITYDITV